jgi:hypothetical protein
VCWPGRLGILKPETPLWQGHRISILFIYLFRETPTFGKVYVRMADALSSPKKSSPVKGDSVASARPTGLAPWPLLPCGFQAPLSLFMLHCHAVPDCGRRPPPPPSAEDREFALRLANLPLHLFKAGPSCSSPISVDLPVPTRIRPGHTSMTPPAVCYYV